MASGPKITGAIPATLPGGSQRPPEEPPPMKLVIGIVRPVKTNDVLEAL